MPDCVLSKALNRARHLALISCDLFILTGSREEKLDHLIIVKHENDLIKHLMEPGESRAEPSRAGRRRTASLEVQTDSLHQWLVLKKERFFYRLKK